MQLTQLRLSSRPEGTRPLADWEGDRVLWEGSLDYWEPFKGDRVRFILTPVSVRHWASGEVRHLHHLWFMSDREYFNSQPVQRFRTAIGNGIVERYQRTDGSSDYGIRQDVGVDVERFIDSVIRSVAQYGDRHIPTLQSSLARFREDFAAGRIFAPYNIDRAAVERELDALERLLAAKLQTKAVQQMVALERSRLGGRSFAAPPLVLPHKKRRKAKGVQ